MSEFIGETPRPHRADVEKRARRDRVFLNNPVIMQGLGLAPLIVAATTLKNDVMLSVAVLLLSHLRAFWRRCSAALRISGSAGSPMRSQPRPCS